MNGRGRIAIIASGFSLLVCLPGGSGVEASCGSTNCFLITGTQEGITAPGEVTLDLSFRYVPQDRRLEGRDEVSEVLVPKVDFENGEIEPDHHREISTLNLLVEAGLSVGLCRRWALGLALPLFLDREHEHFDEVGTAAEHFTPVGTRGFGDVRIAGRFAPMVATKDLLVVGAGITLPTGAYRLRDDEGAILEPGLQPGSGATDLLASFYYVHQWVPHRWEYSVSGAYQVRGKNPLDYRFGSRNLADAGVRFSPNSRLVLSLQLNGAAAPHDFYAGHLVSSTGSRQISLTPGVTVYSNTAIGFYAHAAWPVYQDVNESQLAARTSLVVGLTGTF